MHNSACSINVDAEARPTPDHRRAILLPEDDARPRFVWISTDSRDPEGDSDDESEGGVDGKEDEEDDVKDDKEADEEAGEEDCEGVTIDSIGHTADANGHVSKSDDSDEEWSEDLGVPFMPRKGATVAIPVYKDLRDLLGDDEPRIGTADLVIGKLGAGEHLDHTIRLCFRDDFVFDGSQPNVCARRLTRNRIGTFWSGPLVVYGMTKVELSNCCVDLQPSDLTIAMEGLVEYAKKQQEGMMYFFKPKPAKKLQGIKVSLVAGDSGQPSFLFEKVDVPRQHPIVYDGIISEVTSLFGLPVLMWQTPDGANNNSSLAESPMPIAFLNLNIDRDLLPNMKTSKASLGAIPIKWRNGTATTLVIRRDGKPLNADLLEAACNFCREEIQPLLLKARNAGSKYPAVLFDTINEGVWEQYLEKKKGDVAANMSKLSTDE